MSTVERTMAELMDGYAPALTWGPLCEEDPEREGWCAYHRSYDCAAGQQLTEGERCRPCQHGNHTGTNGTAGCEGGSCGCTCRGAAFGGDRGCDLCGDRGSLEDPLAEWRAPAGELPGWPAPGESIMAHAECGAGASLVLA